MITFVKACGIRTREAVDWAVELGYTAVGFVLHEASPRYCEPRRVRELAAYARNRIATVGVGVSFDEVAAVKDAVDFIQIYEYRETDRLIFASGSEPAGLNYVFFMYDVSRGSGKSAGFPEWLEFLKEKLIMSGGLNADNVGSVINLLDPFGVDVSTGIESAPGEKSFIMMKKFIQEARNAGC